MILKANSSSFKANVSQEQRVDVLALSSVKRLAYFAGVRVKHPRVESALSELMIMAQPNTGTDIGLLIGPTGAGKTTLTRALLNQFIKDHESELIEDPSLVPIIVMEAPSSGELKFSWPMFYIILGTALSEPLIEQKIETVLHNGRITVKHSTSRASIAAMRSAVQDALKHRKTLLLVVDEAVHIFRNCKQDKMKTYMDALKSLSNISEVTLALVGSYDLYQLMTLTGQVARRSAIVHMQRYMPGVKEDETAFLKALRTLQNKLPLEKIPDLERYAEVLQRTCVGCIGILKDTLTRALATTLAHNGIWKEEFLERALLSEMQINTILSEVLEGEQSISKALNALNSTRLSGGKENVQSS